jgi:hypothetical protein
MGADPELGEDMGEVHFDRAVGDEHPVADLGVGESFGDESHDARVGGGHALQPRAGRARSPRAPRIYVTASFSESCRPSWWARW